MLGAGARRPARHRARGARLRARCCSRGEPVTAALLLPRCCSRRWEGRSARAALALVGRPARSASLVALPQIVPTARVVGFTFRAAHGLALGAGGDQALHRIRAFSSSCCRCRGAGPPSSADSATGLERHAACPYFYSLHFGVVAAALALFAAARARALGGARRAALSFSPGGRALGELTPASDRRALPLSAETPLAPFTLGGGAPRRLGPRSASRRQSQQNSSAAPRGDTPRHVRRVALGGGALLPSRRSSSSSGTDRSCVSGEACQPGKLRARAYRGGAVDCRLRAGRAPAPRRGVGDRAAALRGPRAGAGDRPRRSRPGAAHRAERSARRAVAVRAANRERDQRAGHPIRGFAPAVRPLWEPRATTGWATPACAAPAHLAWLNLEPAFGVRAASLFGGARPRRDTSPLTVLLLRNLPGGLGGAPRAPSPLRRGWVVRPGATPVAGLERIARHDHGARRWGSIASLDPAPLPALARAIDCAGPIDRWRFARLASGSVPRESPSPVARTRTSPGRQRSGRGTSRTGSWSTSGRGRPPRARARLAADLSRANHDGEGLATQPVDVALLGVEVPAGKQRVVIESRARPSSPRGPWRRWFRSPCWPWPRAAEAPPSSGTSVGG